MIIMEDSAVSFTHLSSSFLQHLSVGIREQLEQWLSSSNELSIFVSGRTGSGKSSLVNALLGAKVAEEGAEPDPTTAEVTCHEGSVSGVRVKVWDSPGLQDGTTNEELYLNDIAARCSPIDLFLFCINVADATRFNMESPDVKALAKLTEKLGPEIWNHAIIALTFANRLGQKSEEMRLAKQIKDTVRLRELFNHKIIQWQESLRDILGKIGLSLVQVAALKMIPTGHPRRDPSLPDRPHWLSTFWFEALRSTHPRAQPALLRMNETRIVENPEMVDKNTQSQHSEDMAFIFSDFACNVGSFMYGSKDLGLMIGLDAAKRKEFELTESLVLEQFLIMEVTKEHQQMSHSSASPLASSSGSESSYSPDNSRGDVPPKGAEGSCGPVASNAVCGGPFDG